MMVQNYNDDDVAVFNLLRLSERYYNIAKKNVLLCTTVKGNKNYRKLIFLSIKSLKIILKTYHHSINPQIRTIVLLKLSSMYYEETENYELAETYLNGCFNILNSHSMKRFELVANILLIKVLHKTDRNYCFIKLKNLMQQYGSSPNCLAVLNIVKIHYFKDNFEISPTTESLIRQSNDELQAYFYVLLSHHYLNNNNLQRYGECFEVIDSVLDSSSTQARSPNYYKLKTMAFFLRFIEYYLTGNHAQLELLLSAAPRFGSEAKPGWQVLDPCFTLKIDISENLTQTSFVEFEVDWICRDLFLSLFYIHMGVVLIYDKGLSRAISGASFQSKSFKDKFEYRSSHEIQGSNAFFDSSLNKFQNYYQKSQEIYLTTSYYTAWNNFLQNIKIDAAALNIERPNNGFERKFNRKVLYLESLCSSRLEEFDFEDILNNLESVIDGPTNDLTVYALLQSLNFLKWYLEIVGKVPEKANAVHKMILERSIKLEKMLNGNLQNGSLRSFKDYVKSNLDLSSLVWSLSVILELSSPFHSKFGTELGRIDISEIRCFYSVVVAGLTKALLSENDAEFAVQSKYISNLVLRVSNHEEQPCPPCIQNGDFKHIATCAAEVFHLHSGGTDDTREIIKRIKNSYDACLPGPRGLNNYEMFINTK